MSADTDRWTEIRKIHVESVDAYRILGGVVLVGLGIWIGSILFASDNGYSTNLYTELISISVTVFILDFLNRRRDDLRRKQELMQHLLSEVRSPENSVARHAIHVLTEYEWLQGNSGLLKGAKLSGTRLQEVDLFYANLEKADLRLANLQGASLLYINLKGADLWSSNLKEAMMIGADLQGANLETANLQEAKLLGANLQGANLHFSKLQGANLREANMLAANLQDASIQGANLREAKLLAANLQDAKLQGANLREAKLLAANLQNANLNGANLEGADLQEANLYGVNLRGANLQEADLTGCDLRKADLTGANLEKSILTDTQFDETTILPDTVIYEPDEVGKTNLVVYWASDTDMRKYTERDYSEFGQMG